MFFELDFITRGYFHRAYRSGVCEYAPFTFRTHKIKNFPLSALAQKIKKIKKNPEQQLSYPGLLISLYSFLKIWSIC
jgi:hypothetical protein